MEYDDGIVQVYLNGVLVHDYEDEDKTWQSGKVCFGVADYSFSVAPLGTQYVLFDNLSIEQFQE
jgi:hypothetical protein